jgi:hypothetical protein
VLQAGSLTRGLQEPKNELLVKKNPANVLQTILPLHHHHHHHYSVHAFDRGYTTSLDSLAKCVVEKIQITGLLCL